MQQYLLKVNYLLVIILIPSVYIFAQTQYEIIQEEKPAVKILKGIITKSIIENDTAAFKWYASNQKVYQPDTAVIRAMQRTKDKIQYVIFGGTWCDDTQFILPRFFKLQEKSGVSDNNNTFFGVNRAKKTVGNVAAAFDIINVPTIIVMKDGKELAG